MIFQIQALKAGAFNTGSETDNLTICVSNMHVTPSTSNNRSMSSGVVGCVPTIRLGRMLW
jgi:hypothetical protein